MEKTVKVNKTKIQSPNLLNKDSLKHNPLVEKFHIKISTISKILIIFVQIVYIVLLGLNSTTSDNITKLENEIKLYETKIESKKDIINQIKQINKRVEELKKLEQNRVKLNTKFNNVLNYLPNNSNLLTTSTKDESMKINLETKNALDVSILMSNYLNENIAEKIILKSANFDISKDTFRTEMEIKFKWKKR